MEDESEQPRSDRGGGARKWVPATITTLTALELLFSLWESNTSPAAVATGLALWMLHTIDDGFRRP